MKVFQVFESYPLFYQPYIPPVLESLQKQDNLHVKIFAFKGDRNKNHSAIILPDYKNRVVITKILRLNPKFRNLDFFEIQTLKEKADIIHLQHSFLFPKVLRLLKLPASKRPKIVITLRGGDTYVKPWISERWQRFYKDYGAKVDAFIVMSEDQKKYLSRWGVPMDNIYVIPISFGHRFSIQAKSSNREKMKLVSVFRMCWEKNITDNLRFVKTLKQNNIPVTYDIFGDGPDFGQLFYLRDKYDLNHEVNIFGKVPSNQLKENLKSYDFSLQLSLSESLGMSVIEAQSVGVPAIVSANGGLPEIILNDKNGFVVDGDCFKDSINNVISVWKDAEKYKEMSHNSIELSHQRYSIENEVSELTALYNQIIL